MIRKSYALTLLFLYLLYPGTICEQVPTSTVQESSSSKQPIFPLALSYKVEVLDLREVFQTLGTHHEPAIVDLILKAFQLHNQQPCPFADSLASLNTLMLLQL
jgi:hypothetical protein